MSRIPEMDWNRPNVAETFALFKQTMTLYCADEEITDDNKISLKIKRGIGNEGLRRLNASSLSDEDKSKPNKLWEFFEKQLKIHVNFRVHRLELMQFRQEPGENIDNFVTRCKTLALKCDFAADELQERILELLIASTPFESFQRDLLGQDKNYPLESALTEGRKYEALAAGHQQIEHLHKPAQSLPQQTIDAVKKGRNQNPCRNCGLMHRYKECPAYNDECGYCGIKGHWQKYCRKSKRGEGRGRSQSRRRNSSRSRKKTHSRYRNSRRKPPQHENDGNEQLNAIHSYRDNSDETFSMSYYSVTIPVSSQCLDTIDTDPVRNEAYTTLQFTGPGLKGIHNLTLKVDTGASGNTLPIRTYRQIYGNSPTNSLLKPIGTTRLIAYNGEPIHCYGSINFNCRFKTSDFKDTIFYVVDVSGPAVVGLPTCEALKLVTINCDDISTSSNTNTIEQTPSVSCVEDLKQNFPNQFDKIGDFKHPVKLLLKKNAEPFVDPPRKCSIHMKDAIKQELDRMTEIGVIRRVTEHTDWCSSMVYAKKPDGSIRACLDPQKLNQALKRCPHKIPTLEELNPAFANAKIFTKLDAKSGYWGVPLDESSQLLTTFRTPFGRYCWKRLPFGLSVSQDIFQQRMDEILEGLPGVVSIADDVCVFGQTKTEHDKNLLRVMNRAAETGLVFNSDKCMIGQREIPFFGNLYTDKGIVPDPRKIIDIQNIPTPQSKEDLQRFLGIMTYLSSYIPNYSSESKPLRDLIKKDTPFEWSEDHQACFLKVKSLITSDACLSYYDVKKPLTLEVDASQKGIGAVLLQEKPIAYASKSLTPTQAAYSNIEREALALVHGIQRFHVYLYGRHFTAVTDHKPLVMIHKKPITSAPPRLQRMFLKLTEYDFELIYKPGAELVLPDTLSRLPNPSNYNDIPLDTRIEEFHIDAIDLDLINFGTTKQEQLRSATTADPVLNHLCQIILTGWPDVIKSLSKELRPFWPYRDTLAVTTGIIFKGRQILIPKSLQPDILNQLHSSHQGIEKTRKLARESVYWPTINNDIERLVKSCNICQELQPRQQAEPLQPHEIPSAPWTKIGTDLFQIGNRHFLLAADYLSKYPVVKEINHPVSSASITKEIKAICSLLGAPEEIISDNGPQYTGNEFQQFCREWGIQHNTSSPHFPQSNGFAERMIGTVKPIIKKCLRLNQDIDLALLHLRATPIDNNLPSPAETLMSRPIRTTLPSNHTTSSQIEDYRSNLMNRSNNMKDYHDKKSLLTELPPLYPGQAVRILDHVTKTWTPGHVVERLHFPPRSYIVQTTLGTRVRRNRSQLRETILSPIPTQSTVPKRPQSEQHINIPKIAKQVRFTIPNTETNNTSSNHTEQPMVQVDQPKPKTNQVKSRSGRTIKPPKRYTDN